MRMKSDPGLQIILRNLSVQDVAVGTNRIVIIGEEWVYKVPIHSRGAEANEEEYRNFLKCPNFVAKTIKYDYGLLQERLTNLKIYNITDTEEDILPEHLELYKHHFTHNRLQVGLSKDGCWKIFDCEDVKQKK